MSASLLVERIKETLRAKGLTYAELAKGIHVSESTIKRMFQSPSDITLGRLDDICRFLGISLGRLLEKSLADEMPAFSEKQEDVLSKDLDMLHLYYAAGTIGNTSDLVAHSKKGEKTVRYAMRDLEGVGLLERHIGDRIRVNCRSHPMWSAKGPLMHKVFPELKSSFVRGEFTGEFESQMLRYFLVAPESARVVAKKMMALFLELAELSKLDLRFSRERVIPWCAYFAARPHIPFFFDRSCTYPSMKTLRKLLPSALH